MASPAITQLQAQIPALNKAKDDAIAALLKIQTDLDSWRAKRIACQEARDQFTLSWKKDQACSISNYNLFLAKWQECETKIPAATQAVTLANQKLDNINTQIQNLLKQEQEALLSNPTYALQHQQQVDATANAQKQIEEEQKSRRMIYTILGIIGGLTALFGGIGLMMYFKNKAA